MEAALICQCLEDYYLQNTGQVCCIWLQKDGRCSHHPAGRGCMKMVSGSAADSQAEAACNQSVLHRKVGRGSLRAKSGLCCCAAAFHEFFQHVLHCQKEPLQTLCCPDKRQGHLFTLRSSQCATLHGQRQQAVQPKQADVVPRPT